VLCAVGDSPSYVTHETGCCRGPDPPACTKFTLKVADEPSEKVCFNPAKMKIKYAEAAEAAEESFQMLMTLVEACQREGVMAAGDAKALALLAWSMVHGIAKLAVTGRFPFSSQKEILGFAENVIENSLPTVARRESQYVSTSP
jgi:Tetracyclin repressor-like, C-terminal domain